MKSRHKQKSSAKEDEGIPTNKPSLKKINKNKQKILDNDIYIR